MMMVVVVRSGFGLLMGSLLVFQGHFVELLPTTDVWTLLLVLYNHSSCTF